jgi:hypothetical protein
MFTACESRMKTTPPQEVSARFDLEQGGMQPHFSAVTTSLLIIELIDFTVFL